MKGKRIKTLVDLAAARAGRRAVFSPLIFCFRKPMPAAFAINLTGDVLLRLMESGLFVYKSNHKPRKLCGVCRHPIKKHDTSCDACGSTDFET